MAKGHKVCVENMISIPRRGFILPNVSSTWSRLRAQGHSMMGLIRASLERYALLGFFRTESSSQSGDCREWRHANVSDSKIQTWAFPQGEDDVSMCRKPPFTRQNLLTV
ncbi:unnamed protein product [Leuciscus chuanchicus]